MTVELLGKGTDVILDGPAISSSWATLAGLTKGKPRIPVSTSTNLVIENKHVNLHAIRTVCTHQYALHIRVHSCQVHF